MPQTSSWPFAGLSPGRASLSCTGQPRTGHSAPGVASPVPSREEGSRPQPAGKTLANAAQDTVSVPGGKGTLLAHDQLGAHQGLQGFSCKAAFQPGSPPHVLVPGVVPPQVRDFALPLVELLGAPALAGYGPRVTQRAAPRRDSVQEEGFGRRHSQAAPSSAGW